MVAENQSEISLQNFEKLKRKNIQLLKGEFDHTIPQALDQLKQVDLVYFDGNHRKGPTLSYFEKCLARSNEQSIFIFDDIHWSREMNEAWKIIQAHPSVTSSIDLFQLGIVFFRPRLNVEHFVIKY